MAPELIQWMQTKAKGNPGYFHAMNEERKARLAEAEITPDAQDWQNAQNGYSVNRQTCRLRIMTNIMTIIDSFQENLDE